MIETKATIKKIVQETQTIRSFELELENKLTHEPGQFVMIWLENEPETKRAYSISSYRKNKKQLRLTIRKIGKFTTKLFEQKEENQLIVKGPYGKPNLLENEKEKIMIAGGTGISHFLSFIEYFNLKGWKTKTTLLYSCCEPQDAVQLKEMQELEKTQPEFKMKLTCPEKKCDEKYEGCTEHISAEFIQKNINTPQEKEYYLCGPPGMVKAVEEQIINKLKVPAEQVHAEKW
jgi:NAD(P)H-flavin reductase